MPAHRPSTLSDRPLPRLRRAGARALGLGALHLPLHLALLFTLGGAPAQAADWLEIHGDLPADAPTTPQLGGFLQIVGEGIVGGERAPALPGALAEQEGVLPTFNRVGPGDATYGASVRRARFFFRGAVPKTDQRVSYALSAEFGDNQLTRLEPVVLTDAAVNVMIFPALQLRAGQFKLPTAEEALESNPLAARFINNSAGLTALLLENPVLDGKYAGGASGLRDVGAQLWGRWDGAHQGLSAALMVSNGRIGGLDVDNEKDVTGRIHATLWAEGDPRDPHREALEVFGWWLEGSREGLGGPEAPRMDRRRRGAGISFATGGLQARSELIDAVGAIDAGTVSPFPGQPVLLLADGQGLASSTFAHYTRPIGGEGLSLGGGLRYDRYARRTDRPTDERLAQTWTGDLTLGLGPRAHLMLDYERRSLHAPAGPAAANALLDTLGDRLSAQLVIVL